MRRVAFLLLFSSCFLQLNAKNELALQWEKANQHYAKNQFDSAIQEYTNIIKDSIQSSAVFYNLGNAYYRINNFEKAVISYKIALLKDYGNKGIKENLSLANSKLIKPQPEVNLIFFVRWWQNLIHFTNPILWAVLSFLLFLIVLYSFYVQKTGKHIILYYNRYMATFISLFLLFLILAIASTNVRKYDQEKVIQLEQKLKL